MEQWKRFTKNLSSLLIMSLIIILKYHEYYSLKLIFVIRYRKYYILRLHLAYSSTDLQAEII